MSEAALNILHLQYDYIQKVEYDNTFSLPDNSSYLRKLVDSKSFIDSKNFYYPSSFLTVSFTEEFELTNQIEPSQQILPSYYTKNMEQLNSAFKRELTKYGHYLTVNSDIVDASFNQTASIISELPFEKATVEITKDNGLKFTLLFPNDKLLLISKPLEQTQFIDDNEIVFSFFINRELILSNAASTSSFVQGFKEYLSL